MLRRQPHLHLTTELLSEFRAGGIDIVEVELIVGIDTFRPVEVERLDDHIMHSESYRVDSAVFERVNDAARVIAVGTTSTRALESAATTHRLQGEPICSFVRVMTGKLLTSYDELPSTTNHSVGDDRSLRWLPMAAAVRRSD